MFIHTSIIGHRLVRIRTQRAFTLRLQSGGGSLGRRPSQGRLDRRAARRRFDRTGATENTGPGDGNGSPHSGRSQNLDPHADLADHTFPETAELWCALVYPAGRWRGSVGGVSLFPSCGVLSHPIDRLLPVMSSIAPVLVVSRRSK